MSKVPEQPAPLNGDSCGTQESTRFRRYVFLLPVVVFIVLSIAFGWGLTRDPAILPSALIGKPVPAFDLPPLSADADVPGFSNADLVGAVSVVNIFASWCLPCRVEHPVITRLSKSGMVKVYGLNYRDEPKDAEKWLKKYGNPYAAVGSDRLGRVAIDWGLTGVPETFIIDKIGRIRFKQVGVVTYEILEETFFPLIEKLRNE